MEISTTNVLGKFFTFIILWNIGVISYGQTNLGFSISGIVADSTTKTPIEYASVAIYKINNSTPFTGMITNDKGGFVIYNLNNGEYVLKANFIGYKTKTEKFAISNSSVQLNEPVLLNSSAVSLAEVKVTGNLNEKQVSIEKTRINVSQNISSVSGNVTEVLKSQSSINIDADNNIYLRGNGNILILMDGKPTTVTSLNSIPATNIENIEILTNPDAKYDAEGTGGIINIITKKTNHGLNAAITFNYGIHNRINTGLSVNYSKGIWDLGLSYNERYEKANITSNLMRLFYAEPTLIEQNIHSIQINTNHMASMLISARPNKKNMVTFGMNFLMPELSNKQDILGNQTDGSAPEFLYSRRNEVGWSRKIIEGTFSYKKIFEKNKNEISFDAFYSHTKGSRPSDYYINNEYLQKSKAGGAPVNMTFQVDYFKQLPITGRIETGAKIFSRSNSFTTRFYDRDTISGDWIINPDLSSDLTHKEYIYSSYLMYSDTLLKKLFYKIGGRVEYNTSDVNQLQTKEEVKYKRLFPFPFLQLNLEREARLRQAAPHGGQHGERLAQPHQAARQRHLGERAGAEQVLAAGGDHQLPVVVAHRRRPVARTVHEQAVGEGHAAEAVAARGFGHASRVAGAAAAPRASSSVPARRASRRRSAASRPAAGSLVSTKVIIAAIARWPGGLGDLAVHLAGHGPVGLVALRLAAQLDQVHRLAGVHGHREADAVGQRDGVGGRGRGAPAPARRGGRRSAAWIAA